MTGRGEFVTAGHLGGFFRNGDPDTTYPNLWEWLVKTLGVQFVLDVGCGDGHALDHFWHIDGVASAIGIDGMPQEHASVREFDFTTGHYPWPWDFADIDLVWSCEFVEHVEAQYLDNFLPALAAGRWLAMTHAVPGQTGHHHVNCQPEEFWVDQLARYGMVLDPYLTAQARAVASTDAVETNYFARTGLVFEKGNA